MTVHITSKPAALNNWASGEYANGRREKKVGAILHIMVGYLPGTTALFQNPNTGYATSLGVGTVDGSPDGQLAVHRYVPADGYAYGSYNSDADRRGESIEMQGFYEVDRRVLDCVAQLLVQLYIEEGWPPIGGKRQFVLGDFPDHRFLQKPIPDFGVKYNLITHRSMAEKNCPNDADLGYLLQKANQLLTETLQEDDMTVTNKVLTDSRARSLEPGKRYLVYVDSKTTSTAFADAAGGDLYVSADLTLTVDVDEPGTVYTQPERYELDAAGKAVVLAQQPVVEHRATPGNTYAQHAINRRVAGNDRLRFALWVDKPCKLVRTEIAANLIEQK